MDELTVAAAVLAMDVESNAEEDEEQDLPGGEPGAYDAGSSASRHSELDKENHLDLPEQREVRADHLKVSKHHRTQLRAQPALSFAFWWHPG